MGSSIGQLVKQEMWANAHETRETLAVPVRKLSVYRLPFRRGSFLECTAAEGRKSQF